MNTFDLLALALLAAGFFSGFRSGAIRQVAGAIGFLLALALALKTMKPVGMLVQGSLGVSPRVAPLAGFVVVFAGVQLALFAAVRVLEGLSKATHTTVLNRLGGGALGALRTALVMSAVLVPLRFVNVPRAETRESSLLYAPVAAALPAFWNTVKGRAPSLADRFRSVMGPPADSTAADSLSTPPPP